MSEYVIVRTEAAGVFAGTLESRKKRKVTLSDVRRLWYWAGAATLSELAISGPGKPNECKFPAPVTRITVLGAIEIIEVTAEAEAAIRAVPIWTAK